MTTLVRMHLTAHVALLYGPVYESPRHSACRPIPPQGISSESCSRDNRRIVGSVKTEMAVPPAEPEASHSCAHAYRRSEPNPSAHVWTSTEIQ